jgi:thiol-disulfide isomerase/thioredoxin
MIRNSLASLVLWLTLPMVLFAQGVPFVNLSWAETVALAQKEKKPIFVDAYAVWCGPCKKMDQLTFSHQAVTKMFGAQFISFKIDMEKGEGPLLKKQFGVSAYPTLLWLDPEQEILLKVTGFQEANKLMELAKSALEKYNPYADMDLAFQEGNRSPAFILEYMESLNNLKRPVKAIAKEYFKDKPWNALSEVDKKILFYAVEESDSKYFDFVLQHRDWYASIFGSTLLEERVEKACLKTVEKAYEYQYEGLVEEAKAQFQKAFPDQFYAFALKADLKYALLAKNKDLVAKTARALLEGEYSENRDKLLQLNAQISNNIEGKSQEIYTLRKQLLERAEDLQKDPEIYFLLAKLHLQYAEVERAIVALEKVLENSKEGEVLYAQAQKKLMELREY